MPLVCWHGLRLRRMWADTEGAIGVSLAVDLTRRTTYSVSVWESQDDLQRWLRSPYHGMVMRKYRGQIESSKATSWHTEHFDLTQAWTEAHRQFDDISVRAG